MSEARKGGASNHPVIPDKLYFRIGEVARLLAVEPHTLRFWEGEFPQLRVNKGGTGQRLYRRKDVETVLEIKRLLYDEGYTIPGARQLLQSRSRRKDTAERPAAAEVPAGKREAGLERMRSELREISSLLSRPVTARPVGLRNPPRAALPARRGLHLAGRSTAGAKPESLFADSPE